MAVIQAAMLEMLADVSPSTLPTEFRLFAFGENKTSKGSFVLDRKGAESVMASYREHGVDLAIDYEHQTFRSEANGQPAPAAGWFQPEVRNDGLWAVNVRWTDSAAAMLSAKEYRYFSPTFAVEGGRITRLLPLALTNFPATKNQEALIAASDAAPIGRKDTDMNVNSIIGLKEDASEHETGDRVVALANIEKQLLEFTGKGSVAEAMSLVISAKDTAVKLAAAEKALGEWETREAQTRAIEEQKAIDAAIDGAISTGRVSLRDTEGVAKLRKFGETFKFEALREHIAMLPSRPVRVYQAPAATNTEAAQLQAVNEYAKANNVSTADAYVALSAQRPALFSHEGGR